MSRLSPALALLGAAAVIAPSQARIPSERGATLRASLYYVAVEGDYPAGRDGVFRGARGEVLHRGSRAFLQAASVEGSARTARGVSLTFDPEHPARGWSTTLEPYGLDALGCPLAPYRTVAAPKWMPLGTRLYIPETVGLPLPDGRRHDGFWYATDRGVGIEGDRIDLFMRLGEASMRAGERFGLDYLKPLHVRVVGRVHGCPAGPSPHIG
ncbi:MAG TPA: 3D domain-containing protein [Phenylobacterium sp.]|uniref:3D domain-containing protein n=1 Tax=Phenylobacterium sp. TaxID=1871053 RepID=UPI002B47781F|nr:3D domain-containing protein [Phenylobacterium sp.]HKR88200.1 3D domain-containing protein [Phenylobacterium sp.]